MNFNSFTYAIFLALVVMLHFALPQRLRWVMLLAASYYFYMSWNAKYAILLVVSTLIDWGVSLLLERTDKRAARRGLLLASVASNLGLLFAFKYYGFAVNSLQRVATFLGTSIEIPLLHVLLPVGISFYTFQSLSYTIDVYRRQRSAERHLGLFALYVSFFPQLVAGPIERSTTLLPQFRVPHVFRHERFVSGMKLILWGLFKKVVISDQIAVFVDRAYAAPWDQSGFVLLIGTFFFAFQIYCDFSGYSDIAIGSARLMGYELMINFRRPYFAQSLTDFWRRWHVSLSTWFRDYLYFPLGGNRAGFLRSCMNIMIVFIVSGFWHGAQWTFVIWGLIHGVIMVAERMGARLTRWPVIGWFATSQHPARIALSTLFTFGVVLLSWVFFRAAYVQDAIHIVSRILLDIPHYSIADLARVQPLASTVGQLLLIALLLGVERAAHSDDFGHLFAAYPRWFRWGFYYLLLLLLLVAGRYDGKAFIYFQF